MTQPPANSSKSTGAKALSGSDTNGAQDGAVRDATRVGELFNGSFDDTRAPAREGKRERVTSQRLIHRTWSLLAPLLRAGSYRGSAKLHRKPRISYRQLARQSELTVRSIISRRSPVLGGFASCDCGLANRSDFYCDSFYSCVSLTFLPAVVQPFAS